MMTRERGGATCIEHGTGHRRTRESLGSCFDHANGFVRNYGSDWIGCSYVRLREARAEESEMLMFPVCLWGCFASRCVGSYKYIEARTINLVRRLNWLDVNIPPSIHPSIPPFIHSPSNSPASPIFLGSGITHSLTLALTLAPRFRSRSTIIKQEREAKNVD